MTSVVQTLITGAVLGGLYAVFALGLGLTWALLRVINYALFAFVFLAAYVTYDLSSSHGMDPLVTLAVTIPAGVLLTVLLQAFTSTTKIDTFGSLVVTFGIFLVVQAGIILTWGNDLVRIPLADNPYFVRAWHPGPFTVPFLGTLALAAAVVLCGFSHWLLNKSYSGKAMRASVQDPEMAAAFGINSARLGYIVAVISGVAIAVTGSSIGMLYVLTPSDAATWVAVAFATVLLGGLGNPLGLLVSAILLAVTASATQQFADPATAKLTPLIILVAVILLRPQGLFRPAVESVAP